MSEEPVKAANIVTPLSSDMRRQPVGAVRWMDAVAAFRHPNYRIFFCGQIISLIGTWIQTTAEGWLVYELSGSPVALGMIRAAHMLPFALIALWGGIVADRRSKREILIYTQLASMLLALLLAALVWQGWIAVWQVAVIGCLLGFVNGFDVPARQAFVVELVGRQDLMNGIALNSSMFNLARVAGPAVAGVLIGVVGMAGCFLLNGLSYIAVIIGYAMLRLPKFERRKDHAPFREAIAEALAHILRDRTMAAIMVLVTTFSMFGASSLVLMPVFASDILGGDARAFGILMSANGAGALLGGVMLATTGRFFHPRHLGYAGLFGCCICLMLFSISRHFVLSCVFLLAAGFFMIVFLATANTSVQVRAPDELRGRIMGFYSLSFLGMSSIGSLAAGVLARFATAPGAVIIGSVICILVGVITSRRILKSPA